MLKKNIRAFVSRFGHSGRIFNKREISRFCGQLQMLLASGVPLLEGLRIVRGMTGRKEFDALIQGISEGESLARAMQEYFPPMVTSSVEGAERAGNLEEVLARLSKYYEDRAEVEEKIKSALIYPSFVIILCLISLIVLFLFVLPGFKNLFLDLDTDLPVFTQVLMSLGDVFSKTWFIPFLFLFTLGVLFSRFKRTKQGALKWDKLILKIKLLSREQVIQSLRTLGSLLQGGIPIVEALKTTANSIKNRAFQQIMLEIKLAIENGERMSEVLSRYSLFPKESIQMISVGEQSGKLAEMLLNISSFYEKEREVFIKRFTTLLEPTLTLAVGVLVGMIAIGMFLPMINMISKLQ
jgi:type II secretory pathway component PulF